MTDTNLLKEADRKRQAKRRAGRLATTLLALTYPGFLLYAALEVYATYPLVSFFLVALVLFLVWALYSSQEDMLRFYREAYQEKRDAYWDLYTRMIREAYDLPERSKSDG